MALAKGGMAISYFPAPDEAVFRSMNRGFFLPGISVQAMKSRRLTGFVWPDGAALAGKRFAQRKRNYLNRRLQFCCEVRRTNKEPKKIADYR
jgi:hypothetical protein